VEWVWAELAAVSLAAMLSPTTVSFSVLALVLGDRPFRTGLLFYLGALIATLGIGVVAAFVLGDVAASSEPSTPKRWVAILDVVAAVLILAYGARLARKPPDPAATQATLDRMRKLASSPAIAIVGAGAALANPGGFIPLALKEISEIDPSRAEYMAAWVAFSFASLLPLSVALVLLVVARRWTLERLQALQRFFERRLQTIFVVLLVLVAVALLRNGIAGLTA
jgi:hypothetical protein